MKLSTLNAMSVMAALAANVGYYDDYSGRMIDAKVAARRLERSIKHRTGAWRGDGVAPAETRQQRRARQRKAVAR